MVLVALGAVISSLGRRVAKRKAAARVMACGEAGALRVGLGDDAG